MSDGQDDARSKLDQIKKDIKRKKKKFEVPEEFLDNANSYDDKLMLVKFLTEKEKQRVVLMVKKMLQSGMADSNKKKGLK